MEQIPPQAEHLWLHKLVGEWVIEGEANMGPDKPLAKSTGTETVRAFGPFWVMCEGKSLNDMGSWEYQIALGYDPVQKFFPGTFIGTMMPHLWTYQGTLEANETKLVLAAEGPSMTASGMAKYKDTIEIEDNNTRYLKSEMEMPDGTWMHFMTQKYTRKA